ncbi:uncharacterized protein (TIGR02186 family) [Rhizomicrobium palustre]|uniref:Uncharacterized protein (TIGR02186 family) n=1 Tax=Rhizomicrobium palustre TaxID=189966 RepID=A0A846MWA0_9PROT|nr:TIGR02186 family protein [Rhizomicrobium palustre]NIK87352.1 uncharacterized protein (TIGR02186 family) [Rhizomicrobium palustre]
MRTLALACLLFFAPAFAEQGLTSMLSQDYLQIYSNFQGSEITVFGALENSSDVGPDSLKGQIVVVVRGPDALQTVRKKERVAGIWINRARAKMWLPSYYFVASTAPLANIASGETLRRYELGLNNLQAEVVASDGSARPYQAALVRAQQKSGLYRENPAGVEQQSTAFRVHVPVPASVPRGSYTVEVYLFRDGNVIAAQSTPFYVDQAGFERRLFEFAHQKPLYYGVATVLMGILLGWGSTFFFKRS